jgi:hypothetical protein
MPACNGENLLTTIPFPNSRSHLSHRLLNSQELTLSRGRHQSKARHLCPISTLGRLLRTILHSTSLL